MEKPEYIISKKIEKEKLYERVGRRRVVMLLTSKRVLERNEEEMKKRKSRHKIGEGEREILQKRGLRIHEVKM